MGNSLLYDEGGLSYSPDFCGEALRFFQVVGHTSAVTPLVVATDILHCIYSELNFNVYFDKIERLAFSRIESLSHLFTLGADVFEQVGPRQVRYYAISLDTVNSERTAVANDILRAFAKNTADYLVILFRHENMCMLAFTVKTNGCMTFFSDWIGDTSVFDIADRIDVGNLTLKNSGDFFFDFVYMVARSYYTHPISRDYAHSEWYAVNVIANGEDDYDRRSWSEVAGEIVYAHIYEYGDDFIDTPLADDYQTDVLTDSEFDLLKLEMELEEMLTSQAFDFGNDEDEREIEDDDFSDNTSRIDAENIPPEILSDPVMLLEWLKKNEQLNKYETNEGW